MGSYLYTGAVQFAIQPEQEEPARLVLLQFAREYLTGELTFRGIAIKKDLETSGVSLEDLSLDELFLHFGWSLERRGEGYTITGLHFDEDCGSNEYEIFTLLGPFITQGSFIELEETAHGERYHYRYAFTGTRMIEQGQHYDPVPDERGAEV